MIPTTLIIAVLFFQGIVLQVVVGSSSSQTFRTNPYEILNIDSNCSNEELKQSYRKLCLLHHPDKNDDNDEDFKFKEIQHAYSLIGTPEDRRKYDMMKRFNRYSSTTTSSSNNNDVFSGYAYNRFNERDMMNNMFGRQSSSNIYFNLGGKSFVFRPGVNTNLFNNINPYYTSSRQNRNGEMSSDDQRKPQYIQKIYIPLDVLYAGKDNVELKLKTSIFDRYKAAWKGDTLRPVLIQSAATVLLTWLRSQKINWFLSLFLFVSMVHMHLPPPPEKTTYKTTVRKGWKGGTKIKYSDDADVTFIIKEKKHDTYTRVGNDLQAKLYLSRRDLVRGGKFYLDPLCSNGERIKVRIKPNQVRHGETITLKSQGWPISGSDSRGDLKVKICCHTYHT